MTRPLADVARIQAALAALLALAAPARSAAASAGEPVAPAPRAPAQEDAWRSEDEALLRDAAKIERSFITLVRRVSQSTVAVTRYVEKQEDGRTIEVSGGVGSGVVVSRDGKVFTNVHVVAGASRIEVTFAGGETVEAEVHAEMPRYDFALLKVRRQGLVPAEFARTTGIVPGQWALAAGNPRGLALDGTPVVTLGIVSGLGRVAGGQYQYDNAVQTDAEINPGNSGGPLFDLNGRIVGINGLISTTSSALTSTGVGYAIPGDQIQSFLPSLLAGDVVEAGYSGLTVEQGTHEKGGVLVRAVRRGSPADKVGLRAGDRITGVNGARIDTFTDWKNAVAMLPPGRAMTVHFARDGRTAVKRFLLTAPPAAGGRRDQ